MAMGYHDSFRVLENTWSDNDGCTTRARSEVAFIWTLYPTPQDPCAAASPGPAVAPLPRSPPASGCSSLSPSSCCFRRFDSRRFTSDCAAPAAARGLLSAGGCKMPKKPARRPARLRRVPGAAAPGLGAPAAGSPGDASLAVTLQLPRGQTAATWRTWPGGRSYIID